MKNILAKLKIYGPGKFLYFAILEITRKIINETFLNSYSQKGEDRIIDRLLGFKKRGIYVDVGAYDPDRISNTKRFYLKGWRGINIEPDPENYEKFLKERPKDINLNLGIGLSKGSFTFYKFVPDTLSTFSKKEAKMYLKQGYKLNGQIKVKIVPLKMVLDKYLKRKNIDFVSVDTEGFDEIVLKSNDWKKFKPSIICIESSEHNQSSTKKSLSIESYLRKIGYNKIFDNKLNSIYKYKNSL